MAFHTYPLERADDLDDPTRYRYCSLEELAAAIGVDQTSTVLDLGIGTGFYGIDIANYVDNLVGIDIQPGMLERLVKRDHPVNLHPVIAAIEHLPLIADSVDVAYSTMTFHEYATDAAHAAIAEVLTADGRLVAIDWASTGSGESGPSLDERFSLADAVDQLQSNGYRIERTEARPETFLVVAFPPSP